MKLMIQANLMTVEEENFLFTLKFEVRLCAISLMSYQSKT